MVQEEHIAWEERNRKDRVRDYLNLSLHSSNTNYAYLSFSQRLLGKGLTYSVKPLILHMIKTFLHTSSPNHSLNHSFILDSLSILNVFESLWNNMISLSYIHNTSLIFLLPKLAEDNLSKGLGHIINFKIYIFFKSCIFLR